MSAMPTGPGRDRVTVENVNHPGSTSVLDAAKCSAMRDAMLAVPPPAAPGPTRGEMIEAAAGRLPEELFPGGAKVGWWAKTVQLDLEAKGLVAREKTTPLRWHRAR